MADCQAALGTSGSSIGAATDALDASQARPTVRGAIATEIALRRAMAA